MVGYVVFQGDVFDSAPTTAINLLRLNPLRSTAGSISFVAETSYR